jgi:hypothetical protein
MTLEEAGRSAVRAAGAGNLDELRQALEARAVAISALDDAQPSFDVYARLATAYEIGDAIRGEIRSLKLRIAADTARLSQVRTYSRTP